MKKPYIEGVANHDGPESWGFVRKGVTQALTGVRAGQVSSREICSSECRRGSGPGRQHEAARYCERCLGSARSQTLGMPGNLHAREPGDPSFAPHTMVGVGTHREGDGRSR